MRKGSVEAWNLSWCLTGHWGAVRFFSTVSGRKHRRGRTAYSKFIWASVLEASSVCHANVNQAPLGYFGLCWCRICKDNAWGRNQKSRVTKNSSARVSAEQEVHRGCKGETGKPYFPVWQELSGQEGLHREDRARTENWNNRGKKNNKNCLVRWSGRNSF